jgi:hypothetical protein
MDKNDHNKKHMEKTRTWGVKKKQTKKGNHATRARNSPPHISQHHNLSAHINKAHGMLLFI